MLFTLGACKLLILCVIWLVFVLGVPSALGVYVWRKRKKKKKQNPGKM
ncbi:MAG: hypothetical protein AB1696_24365 [Planctomycetota bacterium]